MEMKDQLHPKESETMLVILNENKTRHFTHNRTILLSVVLLFLLCAAEPVLAFQSLFTEKDDRKFTVKHFKEKNFRLAGAQLLLGEITPWAYDKLILNAEYAKISAKSAWNNLSPFSWSWDTDDFGMNQFAHPYHGGTFFNSFRTNGYSFWQSVPAAFAGSYLWETFGENEPPSINDIINTGFGGVIMGEMTYRFSNLLVNNESVGFKRQVNEVLGFIVNPMNGFNRIVTGRWGKPVFDKSKKDTTLLHTDFDLGLRNFNANRKGSSYEWYGHLRLLYGDPFYHLRTPFSHISLNIEFGNDDSSQVSLVNVYGSIAGWTMKADKTFEQSAMLTANYDFIRNQAFAYSAQSIRFNLCTNFRLSHKLQINTIAGAGPVLLAAVPDNYGYKDRYYDYGSGIAVQGSTDIKVGEQFTVNLHYRGVLIKTLNGNPSDYFLHVFTGDIDYQILKHIAFCLEPGYFNLHGHYKYYTDVDATYLYLRLGIRQSF